MLSLHPRVNAKDATVESLSGLIKRRKYEEHCLQCSRATDVIIKVLKAQKAFSVA